ncbi:Bug family tripartite tricarboxylate transporter substrate binding protein [Bordetella pseudohinzii]|uniref:Argininosuccinate lyase n=1 Tax=Bordetella pseudohinzii TaxID=1331258 RepID=A0A0J6CAH3_9BORD|nr:tripartite tricarboxylate transporter substrate binding protein [Bordetella pseudohinzii]ANY17928.1 LacI family transcriptional regulator [Bordetella pseudohinzii]KMM26422.1 LacI family transcriptional regulator [Bordetella pseudohinzii]KXA79046.1 LacI family transcriptional regulator [Bordetella pseudohinzii]KXA80152.1 LacI family transcriptional regulator [Bordetella pseudohinzii]CUI79461.1 Argininosuccinate lyase [Bordetella pseudohinzii]
MHASSVLAALAARWGCCLALVASPALAQDFPSRPITLVAPFAPGGSVDIAARLVADAWGKALGQSIVVENKAGASGNIGMAAVARAKPDGYTLAVNTMSLAINPALFSAMPFDTEKDLRSVGTIGTSQHVLTVNKDLPVHDVKELLAYVRARPANALSFGSAGTGSTFHMAAELFKSVSNTQIMHVPYKGGGPAMLDTISGQVQMSFPVLSAAKPQVDGGKLRALGVTGAKRSALLPDVPTVAESGLPDYVFETWFVISAPAGTPDAVVQRLNATLAEALRSPAISARMSREGFDPLISTPQQTDAMVASEVKRWAGIVKTAGISAN